LKSAVSLKTNYAFKLHYLQKRYKPVFFLDKNCVATVLFNNIRRIIRCRYLIHRCPDNVGSRRQQYSGN